MFHVERTEILYYVNISLGGARSCDRNQRVSGEQFR